MKDLFQVQDRLLKVELSLLDRTANKKLIVNMKVRKVEAPL